MRFDYIFFKISLNVFIRLFLRELECWSSTFLLFSTEQLYTDRRYFMQTILIMMFFLLQYFAQKKNVLKIKYVME